MDKAPTFVFVDEAGSSVAWVFAPGFSALRSLDGAWTSPAPESRLTDFDDGYRLVEGSAAAALFNEARNALSESPVLAK